MAIGIFVWTIRSRISIHSLHTVKNFMQYSTNYRRSSIVDSSSANNGSWKKTLKTEFKRILLLNLPPRSSLYSLLSRTNTHSSWHLQQLDLSLAGHKCNYNDHQKSYSKHESFKLHWKHLRYTCLYSLFKNCCHYENAHSCCHCRSTHGWKNFNTMKKAEFEKVVIFATTWPFSCNFHQNVG